MYVVEKTTVRTDPAWYPLRLSIGRSRTLNTLKGFCTLILFFFRSLKMEVTKATVEGSYSYGGSKLVALDEDSIAYACGNGLRILSLSAGSNSFLWNENEPNGRRSGFTALAYCSDTKQIAVAPRSGHVAANKEGGNDAAKRRGPRRQDAGG